MYRQTIAALVMMPITFTLASGVAQAQNPTRSTAQIDQALRAAIERKDVPGIVALVTDRRGVIYQGTFGVADVATGRPLTADALFRIASMTKAITSAAAMQLIEQGKFALDDPAEKYLPELAKLPVFHSFDAKTGNYQLHPASKPMTVRHLLTHSSGLGYPFTSATLRDFKPRAGEQYPIGPLLFEPGEQWLYGTSTDMVGRLVEKASGQKLEDYFRQHIFAPLRRARHGILLHNRGAGFSLEEGHPNELRPRQRPMHTLAPAMALAGDRVTAAFGCMGGHAQAQLHLQMVQGLASDGLDPATVTARPRWFARPGPGDRRARSPRRAIASRGRGSRVPRPRRRAGGSVQTRSSATSRSSSSMRRAEPCSARPSPPSDGIALAY